MLVTKTVSVERIREAFEAGHRDFGENRVQELLEKKPQLPAEIRWHFIGHLQTNKVKSLLNGSGGASFLVHSLDRIPLAEEIEKQAEKKGIEVDALLEVNTSGEATKSGFSPEEFPAALEKIKALNRIRVRGLMTIAPLTEEEQKIRSSFRTLRELRDRLFPNSSAGRRIGEGEAPLELSMGMSSDFEIAIEEGATIVRIGSAVFGERE